MDPTPDIDKSRPCSPSPCGLFSICRESSNGQPICSCLENHIGQPPNCRPECSVNADCSSDQICDQNKCINPCPSVCGENADCKVIAHTINCNCRENTAGDPFYRCAPILKQEDPINVCLPSPCGFNTECIERNGIGSCRCIKDYSGDPHEGCRPECVSDSECLLNLACINNKCQNPCLGVCGRNSDCRVVNHIPTCVCMDGYAGDALQSCRKIEHEPVTERTENVCQQCGANSICKIRSNNQPVCTCEVNYVGSPPNCRPECVINSECPDTHACIKNVCKSPCSNDLCGNYAECNVQNHRPICKCNKGYSGM